MAFQKVTPVSKYYKYSECVPGQVLDTGTFLKSFEGKYGIQYEFKDESGEIVVLNKSGQLDYLMEKFVTVGDKVRITYKGKITLTKGKYVGTEAHNFELEKDGDERSDVEHRAKEVEEKTPWSGDDVAELGV